MSSREEPFFQRSESLEGCMLKPVSFHWLEAVMSLELIRWVSTFFGVVAGLRICAFCSPRPDRPGACRSSAAWQNSVASPAVPSLFSLLRDALDRYWLAEYAPELMAVERRCYPPIETIARSLGGEVEVQSILIPIDCVDGFTEACYARPELLLDATVRRFQSAWSFIKDEVQQRFVNTLGKELKSDEWNQKYGEWRTKPYFEGSLRLMVSTGRK